MDYFCNSNNYSSQVDVSQKEIFVVEFIGIVVYDKWPVGEQGWSPQHKFQTYIEIGFLSYFCFRNIYLKRK